jgi:hypothetical protein
MTVCIDIPMTMHYTDFIITICFVPYGLRSYSMTVWGLSLWLTGSMLETARPHFEKEINKARLARALHATHGSLFVFF